MNDTTDLIQADCLRAAADTLGWDGVILPPMVLLGRHVTVIANLISDIHEHRASSGWHPVTVRVDVATWDWPEMRHLAPAPAVHLAGVIAPAWHWRTGIANAAPFTGMCPAAMLLPPHAARDGQCLDYAGRHGVAVLAYAGPGDVDIVYGGRATAEPPALTATARWVHETVYDRLLALPEPRAA